MLFGQEGANELSIKDIEDFLEDKGQATPPVVEEEKEPPATQPGQEKEEQTIEKTRAFARRLKEATIKARNEERDIIAQELGFENYADMQKKREAEILEARGLNPEEVTPIIEQLLQKRLSEDPRLKEFEQFKKQRMEEWAAKELAELKALTGGKISKMEEIPKNVIELWKTEGSLKSAYLKLEGENLIKELQKNSISSQNKSFTEHLANPQSVPPSSISKNKRPMTEEEKSIYKLFNPDVTDEELAKILKDK